MWLDGPGRWDGGRGRFGVSGCLGLDHAKNMHGCTILESSPNEEHQNASMSVLTTL
jgi:hypothetical protein